MTSEKCLDSGRTSIYVSFKYVLFVAFESIVTIEYHLYSLSYNSFDFDSLVKPFEITLSFSLSICALVAVL